MEIIGWATGVNKKILDSTSITLGDKGYVEDTGDSGAFHERRLTSLFVPDTYNVSMDFDWLVKDENGKSELDRFVDWYKYRHKRGVNPFEFPSISDFNIFGSTKTCYYKITSTPSMQKSGFCMRVSMSWQEYYHGVIEIPDEVIQLTQMELKQSSTKIIVKLIFNKSFDTEPTNIDNAYPIYMGKNESGITKFFLQTAKCTSSYGNYLIYSFDKPEQGTYTVYATGGLKESTPIKTDGYSASDLVPLTTNYGNNIITVV